MGTPRAVLAFDSASPATSAAVARGGRLLASAGAPRAGAQEAPDLLALIARALEGSGLELAGLDLLLALAGPGSFTGLRVACATALGLGRASGVPAAGASSLEALALAAPPGAGTVLAAVDALRGEWFVQRFARGESFDVRPLEGPFLARAGAPGRFGAVDLVAGHGAAALASAPDGSAVPLLEPPRLADAVACAASLGVGREWDPDRLVHPLYLRAPALTVRR